MADIKKSGNWFIRFFKISDSETTYFHKGEIVIVFLVGCLIALSLWFLVNLGREYNITMEIPLEVVGYSEEMAFSEIPPEYAEIGVSGEGWKLFSLYRNPPEIIIPFDDGTVNIADIIQQHFATHPDLVLQKVEPSTVSIEVEAKTSKRVPVVPEMDVRFANRFEVIGSIQVDPDSVTVTGAESVLDTLQSWSTEILRLRNVQEQVEENVRLADSRGLVSMDVSEVTVSFDVTELTEGEIRVNVRARNVPDGWQIRFNPSVLTIRYDVPIEYYSEAQEMVPYVAYVDYREIEQDTTGYLEPVIEPVTDDLDLRLRSIQPRRVSYFRVIED